MREADREFRAATLRLEREAAERTWLAWHIAAFGRMQKLPPLKDLLAKSEHPRSRQTPDEMLMTMKGIFLAFGGNPEQLKDRHDNPG